MKLASLKEGRDGRLIVVSKDMTRAAFGPVATMQALLDEWDQYSDNAESIYSALNEGSEEGFAFDLNAVAAPLPRAYQYLDGACYICHIRRNREARGDTLPDDIYDCLLYTSPSPRDLSTSRMPSSA